MPHDFEKQPKAVVDAEDENEDEKYDPTSHYVRSTATPERVSDSTTSHAYGDATAKTATLTRQA